MGKSQMPEPERRLMCGAVYLRTLSDAFAKFRGDRIPSDQINRSGDLPDAIVSLQCAPTAVFEMVDGNRARNHGELCRIWLNGFILGADYEGDFEKMKSRCCVRR
jgi:hypothetical protein